MRYLTCCMFGWKLGGNPKLRRSRRQSRSSLHFYPFSVERKHHELQLVHCGVFITPGLFVLLYLWSIYNGTCP